MLIVRAKSQCTPRLTLAMSEAQGYYLPRYNAGAGDKMLDDLGGQHPPPSVGGFGSKQQ